MGICKSKPNVLSHLDDSVKVMVRHDAKILEKRGQQPGGYVPRAPHPMLDTDEPQRDEMAREEGTTINGDNANDVSS
jgi:hypothetical protein